MKSSYTWFNDTFAYLIGEHLLHGSKMSGEFCRDIRTQQCSLYVWKEHLFLRWKQQLPHHQFQYFSLKSSSVSEKYCEFLLHQFDDWFTCEYKACASGNP